jgi:hypothetical protein
LAASGRRLDGRHADLEQRRRGRLPGDRIIFGAAALPEPERDWLAAAERLPIESIWQGATSSRGTRPAKRSPASPC